MALARPAAPLAVAELTLRRLRSHAWPALAAIACVAAGALCVTVTVLLGTAGRDAALATELAAAGRDARAVAITHFSVGSVGGDDEAMAADARAALERPGLAGPVDRTVLFAESRPDPGRAAVSLVAYDDAARTLTLRSGRAPAPCGGRGTCEAVTLGGPALPRTVRIAPGLRVRIVGRGRLAALPFGPVPPASRTSLNFGSAFVAVRGTAAVTDAGAALGRVPRRTTWIRELDPAAVHPWNADAIAAGLRRMGAEQRAAGAQEVRTPAARLEGMAGRGRTAQRRALLLALQAAAVLLALAALVAALRRPEVDAELERLADVGAGTGLRVLLVGGEAVAIALAGVSVGELLAVPVTLALAPGEGGADALEVAARGLLGPSGLAAFAVMVLAAAAILAAGLRRGGRMPAAAAGALAAALLVALWQAFAQGPLRAADLAGSALLSPSVALLPALCVAAVAFALARALPAALRLARRAPARPGRRLALQALGRGASRSAATVAVATAAVAVGCVALAQERSLHAGAGDAAAFATGAHARAIAPPDGTVLPLGRLPAGTVGVLRAEAGRLDREDAPPVRMLGVPAGALAGLRGWRADTAGEPPAAIAARLAPGAAAGASSYRLDGPSIPARARELTMPLGVDGAAASLSLQVQRADGTITTVPLLRAPLLGRARARIPVRKLAGGTVLAVQSTLELGQDVPEADVRLGPLRADGALVTDFRSGFAASEGAELQVFSAVELEYPVRGTLVHRAYAQQPRAAAPLPVAATPGLARAAGEAGRLQVRAPDGRPLELRVVAEVERVPTVDGEGVLADGGALYATIAERTPGAVEPVEAWSLRPGDTGTALARALPGAAVISLSAREAATLEDPLALALVRSLRLQAGILLAVLAVLLALQVAATLRVERAQLLELEALGVPRRALRRQLVAVAGVVGLLAAAGGLLATPPMLEALLRLVPVTVDARDALPPVLPAIPWALLGTAVLAAVAVGVAAAAAVARRAFAEDEVGRWRA